MGHRHTPEELGGARAVCGADGRFVAPAEERVGDSSVAPQLASSLGGVHTGGASPAPTQIVPTRGAPTQIDERSLPVRAALLALRFYKAHFSILFPGSCRLQPTRSRHAYD